MDQRTATAILPLVRKHLHLAYCPLCEPVQVRGKQQPSYVWAWIYRGQCCIHCPLSGLVPGLDVRCWTWREVPDGVCDLPADWSGPTLQPDAIERLQRRAHALVMAKTQPR